MKKLLQRAIFTFVVPLYAGLFACTKEQPKLDGAVQIRLPLTVGDFTYAEVRLRQGERVVVATPDANGVAEVAATAGAPARIDVSLFSVEVNTAGEVPTPAWRAYVGSQELTPLVGANEVTINVEPVPVRGLSLDHSFDGGAVLLRSLAISITDVATGFTIPAGLFSSPCYYFEVPADRLFEINFIHPSTGALAEFTPDLSSDELFLPLGVPPPLPSAADLSSSSPSFDAGAINADVHYPIECAATEQCSDFSATWVPCSGQVALSLGWQGTHAIQIRYSEIPALGCGSFNLNYDNVGPALQLTTTPKFLYSGATQLTVQINADEAINAASLNIQIGSTAALPCAGAVQINPFTVTCVVSIAAWVGGDLDVRASVNDLSGNPDTTAVRLLDTTSVVDLRPVALVSDPIVPNPNGNSFVLGVDLANFGTVDVCDVHITNLSFYDPTTQSADIGTLGDGTHAALISAAASPSNPGLQRIWAQVNGSGPRAGFLPDGDYRVDIVAALSDCGTLTPLPDATSSLLLHLETPPLQWLAQGRIVLSQWTGVNQQRKFTVIPISDRGFLSYQLSSDDSGIVESYDNDGSSWWLNARGIGSTVLHAVSENANYPGQQDIVVEVSEGPKLLALQAQNLVRRGSLGDEVIPLSSQIGNAKRILWDSVRDEIVAVGDQGAQFLSTPGQPVIVLPCGATTVLDASFSTTQPAYPSLLPNLIVLVQSATGPRHCELEGHSGQLILDAALPSSVTTSCTVTKLLASPLSGEVTVFGKNTGDASCAGSYSRTASGLLFESQNHVNSSSMLGAPLTVALDPYASTAVLLSDGDAGQPAANAAGAWFLATDLHYGVDFASPAYAPTAAAIDTVSGYPLIATAAGTGDAVQLLASTKRMQSDAMSLQVGGNLALAPLTSLVVDAGNRLVFAAEAAQNPTLRRFEADSFGSTGIEPLAEPWPNNAAVLDLALQGPQLISVHPGVATPGAVVTALGVGFAGQNRDEVFVLGVPAEVLSSTPTAVSFRVPQSLARAGYINDAWVLVRSHGRVSGRSISNFSIRPPHALLFADNAQSGSSCVFDCSGSASLASLRYPLSSSPATAIALRSGDSNDGVIGANYSFTSSVFAAAPDAYALSADGHRLLGYAGSQWFDTPFYNVMVSGPDPQQSLAMTGAPSSGLLSLASDPSGRYLALNSSGGVYLFWQATYRRAFGPLPAGTVSSANAVAFLPDGSALVVSDSNGLSYDVYDLRGSAPLLVATAVDSASCPSGGGVSRLLQTRRGPQNSVLALAVFNAQTLASVEVSRLSSGAFAARCLSQTTSAEALIDAHLSNRGDTLSLLLGNAVSAYVRVVRPEALGTDVLRVDLSQPGAERVLFDSTANSGDTLIVDGFYSTFSTTTYYTIAPWPFSGGLAQ